MHEQLLAQLQQYDHSQEEQTGLQEIENTTSTSFLATIPHPETDVTILLRGAVGEERVHLYNGSVDSSLSFHFDTPEALYILQHITTASLPNPNAVCGEYDPRTPDRASYERQVREHLPFNLHQATEDIINPDRQENPDVVALLRATLFKDTTAQVKRYETAEGKKAQLIAKNKPDIAANIPTFSSDLTEIQQSTPSVAASLRALSFGNQHRLMQLVSEYKSLQGLQEKKENLLETAFRGVGEYHLLRNKAITKASMIAHDFQTITDPREQLTEAELAKARQSVSEPFYPVAEKYAAATKLANDRLAEIGKSVFSLDLYNEAVAVQGNVIEITRHNQEQYAGYDYSTVQLTEDHTQLIDPEQPTIEGAPLSYWETMPIVPLLMKSDQFRDISPDMTKSQREETTAHNILTIFDSAQVTNHGAQVKMSEEVRNGIVKQVQSAIAEDRPINVEFFYFLGRMSNPLSAGDQREPGFQDWTFMYKLGQIAKTAELFYKPTQEQPAIQFINVNEAHAFGAIWDQNPEENAVFLNRLEDMRENMGLSETIIFDDLQTWMDRNTEAVLPVVENHKNRIRQAVSDVADSGVSITECIARNNTLDHQTSEDLAFMEEILPSQMKLINPALHFPEASAQDLIRAYEGIMNTVEEQSKPLTPLQQEIRQYAVSHATDAFIHFRAVMLSRTAMQRTYRPDLSVSITSKEDKYAMHTGNPSTTTFPSNGVPVIRYPQIPSFGSPLPGKPWYDVERAVGALAQREIRGNEIDGYKITDTRRFTAVVDPETKKPYVFLEQPYIKN